MAAAARRDLPRLELVCFGPPTIRVDGQPPPPEVLWRKHLALLIYLALSPSRTRSREHLLGLLWPEKPQAQARHSLNEAVRRLRSGLGAERLLSDAGQLALAESALDVDTWRLEAAGQPEAALLQMPGDFLEGFALEDAPAFEEWASAQRARYRAVAASLWVRHGEQAVAERRDAVAADAARRALALQPFGEPAVRLLMRAHALRGDAAGALAAFRSFAETLRAEVGESPSRELAALAERIRTQRWRRGSAQATEVAPPLVGRDAVHRQVFAALAEGLSRGARTVLITGEAGMGKSRLLAEAVERLQLDGAVVAAARPLESDQDAPWSTLRQLMRSGLVGAPGFTGADPAALGVLATIEPSLAERASPQRPRDHGHVAAALASLLGAVADEQPVGIALDDAHYADGPTIGSLRAALAGLSRAPVVLVIASAPPAAPLPRELIRLHAEVGRGLRGVAVELAALSERDMAEVVTALAPWCRGEESERLARRLSFETGGNPFLAVTLLHALRNTASMREDALAWPPPLETFESPLPVRVPPLARVAIMARLGELDVPTRRVLGAAAVLGSALDLDLIASLCDMPRAAVEAHVLELERHSLVTCDGGRFTFAAPLIAQVARNEQLTRGEHRALAARAAEQLAAREDLESQVLRAELLAALDAGETGFQAAVEAARAALAAGARRTARRALRAAERLVRGAGQAGSQTLSELRELLGG